MPEFVTPAEALPPIVSRELLERIPVAWIGKERASLPLTEEEVSGAGFDVGGSKWDSIVSALGWPTLDTFPGGVRVYPTQEEFKEDLLRHNRHSGTELNNFTAFFTGKRTLISGIFLSFNHEIEVTGYSTAPVLQRFAMLCPELYVTLHSRLRRRASSLPTLQRIHAQPQLVPLLHCAYRLMSRLVTIHDLRTHMHSLIPPKTTEDYAIYSVRDYLSR